MHQESCITERGKLRNVSHHTELWVMENRRRMEGGAAKRIAIRYKQVEPGDVKTIWQKKVRQRSWLKERADVRCSGNHNNYFQLKIAGQGGV